MLQSHQRTKALLRSVSPGLVLHRISCRPSVRRKRRSAADENLPVAKSHSARLLLPPRQTAHEQRRRVLRSGEAVGRLLDSADVQERFLPKSCMTFRFSLFVSQNTGLGHIDPVEAGHSPFVH